MLPSILAKQRQEGLSDYIKTTFPMTTPSFKGSLPNLLETKDSVFHEPYMHLSLPFRVADELPEDFFRSIHTSFLPSRTVSITCCQTTKRNGCPDSARVAIHHALFISRRKK